MPFLHSSTDSLVLLKHPKGEECESVHSHSFPICFPALKQKWLNQYESVVSVGVIDISNTTKIEVKNAV